MYMLIPPLLTPGDIICVVAPAYSPSVELLQQGIKVLSDAGFEVELCMPAVAPYHRFSANDHMRLQALQNALDNKQYRAIIAARGGYGTTRIIDKLNFDAFLKNPKWVVGYSDITALLLMLHEHKVASVHGPMVCDLGQPHDADSLIKLLCTGRIDLAFEGHCHLPLPFPLTGTLIGGNLTMLTHCVGSIPSLSQEGCLLCIEDAGEFLYNIDRMRVQLQRAGWFNQVKGIILGHFSECKDTEPGFGLAIQQIFEELSIPVISGFPSGHIRPNEPWLYGIKATLWVQENQFLLSQNIAFN
jgi:muramoyltetrapeptide carboxypeptidase